MNSLKDVVHYIDVPKILNPSSIAGLRQALDDLESEQGRSLLVLRGSQPGVFCTGMDLQWAANSDQEILQEDTKHFSYLLKKISEIPCITVAVINGSVVGGGLGIVATCDVVLASSISSFQLSEGLLGLTPALILPALQQRIAACLIKKMVFTAKEYTAEEAFALNLVDSILQEDALEAGLSQWLNQLVKCNPQSVKDLKALLQERNDYSPASVTRVIASLGNALNETVKRRLRSISYLVQ